MTKSSCSEHSRSRMRVREIATVGSWRPRVNEERHSEVQFHEDAIATPRASRPPSPHKSLSVVRMHRLSSSIFVRWEDATQSKGLLARATNMFTIGMICGASGRMLAIASQVWLDSSSDNFWGHSALAGRRALAARSIRMGLNSWATVRPCCGENSSFPSRSRTVAASAVVGSGAPSRDTVKSSANLVLSESSHKTLHSLRTFATK